MQQLKIVLSRLRGSKLPLSEAWHHGNKKEPQTIKVVLKASAEPEMEIRPPMPILPVVPTIKMHKDVEYEDIVYRERLSGGLLLDLARLSKTMVHFDRGAGKKLQHTRRAHSSDGNLSVAHLIFPSSFSPMCQILSLSQLSRCKMFPILESSTPGLVNGLVAKVSCLAMALIPPNMLAREA